MLGPASVHQSQGRLDKALTMNEKKLGEEHPNILTSTYGLASVFRSQGRYNEAEAMYNRVLVIQTKYVECYMRQREEHVQNI
jgi:tetratricopeptide (TPR) repeat protein